MRSTWRLLAESIARGLSTHRRQIHVFAATTFSLGREIKEIDSGEAIAISSKERTVVDLMRFRSRVGRDLALGALRRYLLGADAKPEELLALARQLRIGSVVSAAMESLLA